MQVAPYTISTIQPLLRSTAEAVGKACTGGPNKTSCGLYWTDKNFQAPTGVGEQMSGLEAVLSLLALDQGGGSGNSSSGPVTSSSGGTSQGNPGAGTGNPDQKRPFAYSKITAGDRAGASILTIIVLAGCISGTAWVALP